MEFQIKVLNLTEKIKITISISDDPDFIITTWQLSDWINLRKIKDNESLLKM